MKHTLIALAVLTILMAACTPSAAPTTVEVTRQVEVTKLVEVTREVVVTVIPTTAPPTPTSGPTATPAPTTDLTRTNKGDGSYMVGSEIAPGIWRSSGSEDCYLGIKGLDGHTEDNTYDPPGGTIRIPPGEWIVVIESPCVWSFLQP